MKPFIGMFVLLCATSASAQTITNADLGKTMTPKQTPAEAVAILAPHQYHPHPICRCDGPTVVIAGTKTPTLGPWEFPVPTPARRLDGTRVDDPPTMYGLPPYWPLFIPSFPPQHRR